jgi:hypothetical protein
MISNEVDDYESDFDSDEYLCDFCGRDVNGYDGNPCPYCCSHAYAPGSEECDWCPYSDECFKLYYEAGQ